ncbi:MAG: alkaline phosphatase family protein [Caulobacteraceae bacterium]
MTRLVFIGAAGLDWAGFNAAVRLGEVPALTALARCARPCWLSGGPPGARLAVWTMLATGVQPEVHGIWRNVEAWAGGTRPIGRASWRVAPLWARLQAAGISTGSVAWPASRPGADWAGVHIDETFAAASGRVGEDWALPLHCAPAEARAALRERRVHPTDITAAMLKPFVPTMADIDQSRDVHLPTLAVTMARAATVQAGAAWLLSEARPQAVFVHHRWLGDVRIAFERFREGPFAGVVAAAWRFLDGLIARLVELAGPETTLILASPGWRDRPGLFMATGGEHQGEGAHVLDVAPTVLGLYGLGDASFPGRCLLPVDGALVQAPDASIAPAEIDTDLLAQAEAAGYAPPSGPLPGWRAQGLAELAWMLLERDAEAAGRVADAALALDPENVMGLRAKVRAHVLLDQPGPLIDLGAALTRLAPNRGWGALAFGAYHVLRGEKGLCGPWLRRAEADAETMTLLTVATLWTAARRPSEAERVFRRLLEQNPDDATAELGLAMALKARRDFIGAEAALGRAADLDPGRAAVWLQFADLHARTTRRIEADRAADTAARLGASPEHVAAARAGKLGDQPSRRAV